MAERVAYDTEPRDWTDSDIAEILRRMAGCIRERGEWRMPGRVVRAGTMTFFEVEAVDGQAGVRGGLWGVPDRLAVPGERAAHVPCSREALDVSPEEPG